MYQVANPFVDFVEIQFAWFTWKLFWKFCFSNNSIIASSSHKMISPLFHVFHKPSHRFYCYSILYFIIPILSNFNKIHGVLTCNLVTFPSLLNYCTWRIMPYSQSFIEVATNCKYYCDSNSNFVMSCGSCENAYIFVSSVQSSEQILYKN